MQIKDNVNLAKLTSFKIGGEARFFAEAKNEKDLIQLVQHALDQNLNFFVLGGGTNILIQDSGYSGLVIKNQMKKLSVDSNLVVAETGLTLPEINNFANKNGFVGFEKLATVPGTLGGALYNNAHWHDSLISHFVEWIDVLKIEEKKVSVERLSKKNLNFGYDDSTIKQNNLIAIRAGLNLPKGDTELARKNLIEYIKHRSDTQPYGTFNSGCVFQNVQINLGPGHNGTSAGWLIEQVGLKGTKIGGAHISQKHGNFFINDGNANSDDIIKLARLCQEKVKEKFNIELEFEIKII